MNNFKVTAKLIFGALVVPAISGAPNPRGRLTLISLSSCFV